MKQKNPSPKRLTVLLRLWNYLYRYKWMLMLSLFLTVAGNLLVLIGPMLSGFAIDAIKPGKGRVAFDKVLDYCALMIVFFLVSSLLSYIQSVFMINLSQKTIQKMRKDTFERLVDLPVGYFDQHQTGDIISRITYDIDTVNTSLSNDLIQICTSFITVFGSLIMMLLISPVMVLVFAVTIPLSIFITKYITAKVRPLFRERSEKLGELNGFVEEIISGQKTIKAYHQEETMIARFEEKNQAATQAFYNAEYYGNIVGPSVNFINNLSISLISLLGAILFLHQMITVGKLTSFTLYSRKFSGPINELANIISELQSSLAAAERVFRLMDEPPEPADKPGSVEYRDVSGDVEMNNISFGYLPDRIVLENLNLKADRGSLIAIVGPTGAGKTTLINLLMRFYDPNSGHITLDGTDIKDATRKSLRQAYAMVLQDTWLFHGTIYENLTYGNDSIPMEDVIKAAKAVKIHHYIETLPEGYQTVLNEDGINISQGQKQLLTIARAMLSDCNMLILDEATSNVDTRTEIEIQKAMRVLMQNKTCFIIAHRLSTIENADIVLVVKDGNIAEQGSHTELIAKKGIYAELYHSQFQS